MEVVDQWKPVVSEESSQASVADEFFNPVRNEKTGLSARSCGSLIPTPGVKDPDSVALGAHIREM